MARNPTTILFYRRIPSRILSFWQRRCSVPMGPTLHSFFKKPLKNGKKSSRGILWLSHALASAYLGRRIPRLAHTLAGAYLGRRIPCPAHTLAGAYHVLLGFLSCLVFCLASLDILSCLVCCLARFPLAWFPVLLCFLSCLVSVLFPTTIFSYRRIPWRIST